MANAKAHKYTPPSSAPAETELQRLSHFSRIVPDTIVPERMRAVAGVASAGVISHSKMMAVLHHPSREVEAALVGALAYDRCRLGGARGREAAAVDISCLVDKALVNLGADLVACVSGRVSTEIDARLAHDTKAMVAEAKKLRDMYAEMGVGSDRLLFEVPATWEGIQAVKALEESGVECVVRHVYSLAQAAAACAVGAAVVQPSVGSITDYFRAHPNALGAVRGGPRADAGRLHEGHAEAVEAGRDLVAATAAYAQANKLSKTKIMAAARTVDDVLALAGCDYLVAPLDVIERLAATPTAVGYNDGIMGALGDVEERSALQARADKMRMAVQDIFPGGAKALKREAFDAALEKGPAGALLAQGLKSAAAGAERCDAHFKKLWPPSGSM